MRMIRTPHFRQYCEDIYVYAGKTTQAWSEQQAKDKFKEGLFDDFNSLAWIMDNIFPHSRRNGESYEFVTNDIDHRILGSNQHENVGRLTLTIDKAVPRFKFDNPRFVHGHLNASGNGTIGCHGGYMTFGHAVVNIGFSGALMDLYNFAQVSAHSILPSQSGGLSV